MKPSINCLNLTKHFEGCKLTAYPDPGTGDEPWTIGWGDTSLNGKAVKKGDTVTQEEADNMLVARLNDFGTRVAALLRVPVTQNQFDALVDFAYNVGVGNLMNSTLLKKLNAKDFQGAADQFPLWNKAAGKVLPGLTARRMAERTLFMSL